MRGPEAKIQDKVISYARERWGVLAKKNETGRYNISSGWPDYAVYPDRSPDLSKTPFFIEFKAPGGKLTPLQVQIKKELEKRGYKYYTVDSTEQGKIIIDQECRLYREGS